MKILEEREREMKTCFVGVGGDGVGFSLLLVACNCFAVVFFASNFRHTYSHSP